jgi:hypothetical protein
MSENTRTVIMNLYRNVKYDYDTIYEVSSYIEEDAELISIASPISVTFLLKSKEEQLVEEIAAIDKSIEKETEEMLKRIEILKGRKADLLALGKL